MQTLHLRFRALRVISLRQGLSRWRTPSDAMRAGMGAAFALPNPPEPTCAVGWRPASRHPVGLPCPADGAGSPGVSRLRAARTDSRGPVLPCRVCRWQTADVSHQSLAHHEAGEIGGTHRQARASVTLRAASDGLSFPLRPQRSGSGAPPVQQRNAPPERFQEAASPSGTKTADLTAKAGALAGFSSGVRDDRSLHRRG